jgi:hypothetical protein
MTRAVLLVAAALAAVWLLGAFVQGLLVSTSLTARKIWLFQWWLERFGLGVLLGFALGFVVCLVLVRGRSATG